MGDVIMLLCLGCQHSLIAIMLAPGRCLVSALKMEVTRITKLWKFVHHNTVASPNNESNITSKQVDADPKN